MTITILEHLVLVRLFDGRNQKTTAPGMLLHGVIFAIQCSMGNINIDGSCKNNDISGMFAVQFLVFRSFQVYLNKHNSSMQFGLVVQ